MIDEIRNLSPQRVITPANNVFDKPGVNAKSENLIKELNKQQPTMSSKMGH